MKIFFIRILDYLWSIVGRRYRPNRMNRSVKEIKSFRTISWIAPISTYWYRLLISDYIRWLNLQLVERRLPIVDRQNEIVTSFTAASKMISLGDAIARDSLKEKRIIRKWKQRRETNCQRFSEIATDFVKSGNITKIGIFWTSGFWNEMRNDGNAGLYNGGAANR